MLALRGVHSDRDPGEGHDLVATDQPHELAVSSGWTESSLEWAGGLERIPTHGLVSDAELARRVVG